MKVVLLVTSLILLSLSISNGFAESVKLTSRGKSDAVIVVSSEAPDPELYAARELQQFLCEITEVLIPIRTDSFPLPDKAIILGDNRWTKMLMPDLDISQLGKEGYILKTLGERLLIVGGPPRGTLFGVYGLLEDHLGCRWFTPDCSRIPKDKSLVLPELDETIEPILEYREPFYTEGFDGTWMLRNRMNTSRAKDTEGKGGKVVFSKYFCHTFYGLVPPDKYFEKHPEYFSLVGGERRSHWAQLCLSNPEVLKIATKNLLKWIEKEPEANIFSVSQNDCHGPCECPDCQAIDTEEGSHAGSMIRFVNAIAKEVEKEYPDVLIETLAYQYTRKPPKTVKTRKNVVVRLCTIECCFGHPLATDDYPHNQSFRKDIIGWNKMAHRLYVWDYVTNFGHYVMPFPNFDVLKPNINFFIDNGVKGIFEQGNYSPGGHGELAPLRTYVLAKLLWNPDYDIDIAMNEFLDNYYGDASRYIREYIDLLHTRFYETGNHLTIYMPYNEAYMDSETMTAAEAILARAEKAVRKQPQLLQRVRDARLPVLYVQIESQRNRKPRYVVKDGLFGPADFQQRDPVQEFTETALALGMTNISEGRMMSPYLNNIQAMKQVRHPVQQLLRGDSSIEVTGGLGGRLLSWNISSSKWQCMSKGVQANDEYPQDWGYCESYSLTGAGAIEDYSLKETKSGFIVSSLPSGMGNIVVEREYLLDDEKPVLTVRTCLANRSEKDESVPVFFKANSNWKIGKLNDVIAHFPDSPQSISVQLNAVEDIAAMEFDTKTFGDKMILWNQKDQRGLDFTFPDLVEKVRLLPLERNGTVRVFASSRFWRIGADQEKHFVTRMQAIDEKPENFDQTTDIASLPKKTTLKLTAETFRLFQPGSRSKIISDSSSDTGICAWMPGGIRDWAVQADVPYKELDPNVTYKFSAMIKVEKTGNIGQALTVGVYDGSNGRIAIQSLKNLSDLKDEGWQKIEIGSMVPAQGLYFWAAPEANGANMESLLVESFLVEAVEE